MLDEKDRSVFAAADVTISYWNKLNPNQFIPMSKERLFYLPYVMQFKKYSCLVPTVDMHVGWLTSSGFVEHWLNRYHDKRFLKKRITKEPQILSMDQLYAVFYICLVLYIFSFIIFILEMFASKCKVIRTIFEYL